MLKDSVIRKGLRSRYRLWFETIRTCKGNKLPDLFCFIETVPYKIKYDDDRIKRIALFG